MYKHSPRATLKATDKLVQEVEKLRLVHWAYAFRFLRVCLGMQSDGHSDTAATLKNLGAIAAMADEHRHIAMQITAATIEAMVHLRSDAADAVEMAQRAMASARTHQLGDEMQKMPQIRILLDCLDLSCSFVSGDPNLIVAKLNQMHQTMDPATHQSGWSKDGTISIEMAQSTNEDVELDTCGLMKNKSNQMSALNLRWTNQNDIYVIGYLLSGIAHLYKGHKGKAEPYLQEVRHSSFELSYLSFADQLYLHFRDSN